MPLQRIGKDLERLRSEKPYNSFLVRLTQKVFVNKRKACKVHVWKIRLIFLDFGEEKEKNVFALVKE